MIFIITGSAESGRNNVGSLLADSLGWEFVEAETFHHPGNPDEHICSSSPAAAGAQFRILTLSAAINFWTYEWRDVVVSCPVLTGEERKQLSALSALVKIVCLEGCHEIDCGPALDRSADAACSQSSAGQHASHEPWQDVLVVDSSRQVEDIVPEIAAVLTMRKSA